jgi:protein TonB
VEHLTSVASVPATVTPRAVAPQVGSVAAPTPGAAVDPVNPATRSNANNAPVETSGLSPAPVQGKVQPAAMTERVPKPPSNSIAANSAAKMIETVEPEIKKPSLGKVRLAKPKVGHSSVQANSEIEPALEIGGGTVPSDESSLGAGFAENSKQPAAPAMPIPVGGDVRPARMISSVPPAYPLLAKSQHIAGDVRIDALIDANGRVTTMKVVAGPSLLHQAAMDSLRQWKYQAASLDGKAVPMHLTVTIQFRLQ